MSDEQNEMLVNTNYDMSPYSAYVQYPYYRDAHDFHGDQRFPFFLPILGGVAGGLLAGALFPQGPGPYPVHQPYPVYQPYPIYQPYPVYPPYSHYPPYY